MPVSVYERTWCGLSVWSPKEIEIAYKIHCVNIHIFNKTLKTFILYRKWSQNNNNQNI